jgi:tetrahydromethanopterin S-methyltransferase subunit A
MTEAAEGSRSAIGPASVIGDVVFGDPASAVAVCTLASRSMLARFAGRPEIAIAGRVFTENVGIERMLQNLAANPRLRVLILCGRESLHQVGQTIVSLHRHGLDESARVIGSLGQEPFLPNLSTFELRHFQQNIHLVEMIGERDVERVLARARELSPLGSLAPKATFGSDPIRPAHQPAGLAGAVDRSEVEQVLAASDPPSAWRYDEAGFFLILLDRPAGELRVEHYSQDRVLRRVVRGARAQDVCHTLIRLGLVTELAHAAYLGREVAKAEAALRLGLRYEQDSPLDPSRGH